ncbi:MAG TPA: GspH/FimT family pseudopilin [Nitrospira sp.]|nr:GspH/FimT family pseudopilin [Nitrospira sp.]
MYPRESPELQENNFGGKGVTLTEVATTLAITATLALMAVPSYKTMVVRGESESVAAEVASQLRMARQLAMARRERLLIRFDDVQRSLTFRRADSGEILETYAYADKKVTIPEPTAGPDVLFHPSGRSATATTITIVDREGRPTKLTVSLTGRVKIS